MDTGTPQAPRLRENIFGLSAFLGVLALGLGAFSGCATQDAEYDELYQPKPFADDNNYTDEGEFYRGPAGRNVDVTAPDRGDVMPPP